MNYSELSAKLSSGNTMTDDELVSLFLKSYKIVKALSFEGPLVRTNNLLAIDNFNKAEAILLARRVSLPVPE